MSELDEWSKTGIPPATAQQRSAAVLLVFGRRIKRKFFETLTDVLCTSIYGMGAVAFCWILRWEWRLFLAIWGK